MSEKQGVVRVHARLIEVGSVETISGPTAPMATFEGFGGTPGFRVAISREQAQQLGPLLYMWCYLTIEAAPQ